MSKKEPSYFARQIMTAINKSGSWDSAILSRIKFEGYGDIVEADAVPLQAIKEVVIEGVRAFSNAETLRLSKGLTVVYGANGHGKSSITSALALVNGDPIGAITGQRDSVVSQDSVWHRCSEDPWLVTLRFEGSDDFEVSEGGSATFPIEIVGRQSVRRALTDKPTTRRQELDTALGIVHKTNYLRAIADQLEVGPTNDVAGAELKALASRLGSIKARPGEKSLEAAVERKLASLLGNSTVDDIQSIALTAGSAKIVEVAVPWTSPLKPDSAGVFEAMLLLASPTPEPADELLAKLQEAAIAYLRRIETPADCPACGTSGALTGDRLALLRDELALVADARAQYATRSEAEQRVGSYVGSLRRCRIAAEETIGRIDSASKVQYPDRQWSERVDELRLGLSQVLDQLQKCEVTIAAGDVAAEVATVLAASAHAVGATLDACDESAVAISEAVDELRSKAGRKLLTAEQQLALDLASHKSHVIAVLDEERRIKRLEQEISAAKRGLIEEADRLAAEAYRQLSFEISVWMDRLAPDGTHSTELRASKAGAHSTATLQAEVAGGPVEAVHYLSDSQLDILGLSVRLARMERSGLNELLVLDDPADLLDDDTRSKLIHEVVKLSANRQVLVLTHCNQTTRQLWEESHAMWPDIRYHDVDSSPCDQASGACHHATISSRDAQSLLDRAAIVLQGGDKPVLVANRALASNLVRQALEEVCRNLLSEIDRLNGESVSEAWFASSTSLGTLIGKVLIATDDVKEMISHHICLEMARHFNLNEGSHASPPVPTAAQLRELTRRAGLLVDFVRAQEGVTESALEVAWRRHKLSP